jgi:hypothetical protein
VELLKEILQANLQKASQSIEQVFGHLYLCAVQIEVGTLTIQPKSN